MIMRTERFILQSWHNGLSYNLVHRESNREYFCQGDDATSFDEECENAERAWPDKSRDEILQFVWSTYYSEAATPCLDSPK